MGCGTITIGSRPNCDSPLKGGTRSRLFLANYDDLLSATLSASTPNLITALTMSANTVFQLFEGVKQDVKPTQEVVADGYKHSVVFNVYEITQAQKNNIQRMAKGSLIAILENKGKTTDAFEVYGLSCGLEVVPGVVRDTIANRGGYNITLATPDDGGFEPKLPQTLFATDYATTLALVEEYAGLPTVTNLSDVTLTAAGGDSLTVTGTNFYGNTPSSVVTGVKWINQVTQAEVTQTYTVASDTSITATTVALTAGAYKLRVTTTRGETDSTQVAISA